MKIYPPKILVPLGLLLLIKNDPYFAFSNWATRSFTHFIIAGAAMVGSALLIYGIDRKLLLSPPLSQPKEDGLEIAIGLGTATPLLGILHVKPLLFLTRQLINLNETSTRNLFKILLFVSVAVSLVVHNTFHYNFVAPNDPDGRRYYRIFTPRPNQAHANALADHENATPPPYPIEENDRRTPMPPSYTEQPRDDERRIEYNP